MIVETAASRNGRRADGRKGGERSRVSVQQNYAVPTITATACVVLYTLPKRAACL